MVPKAGRPVKHLAKPDAHCNGHGDQEVARAKKKVHLVLCKDGIHTAPDLLADHEAVYRRIKKQTKRFWREPIRNGAILEKNIRNVNQFSHLLPNLYGFGPPSDKKRCICPWAQIS